MSTHHCCDPAHAQYDEWMRRMRERVNEAEARAEWAELNEGILADKLDDLYRKND